MQRRYFPRNDHATTSDDEHEWNRARFDPCTGRMREPYDERGFERGAYSARYGFDGDPSAAAPELAPHDFTSERDAARPCAGAAARPAGHRARGPESDRRADARVSEAVCARLAAHPSIDASGIEVDAHDGAITLRGEVASHDEKLTAAACCHGVRGIAQVMNLLRVRTTA